MSAAAVSSASVFWLLAVLLLAFAFLRFVAFSHALAPGASGFQPYSSPTLSCWIVWAPGGAPKTERAVGAVLQCVCAEMFLEIQRCLATF